MGIVVNVHHEGIKGFCLRRINDFAVLTLVEGGTLHAGTGNDINFYSALATRGTNPEARTSQVESLRAVLREALTALDALDPARGDQDSHDAPWQPAEPSLSDLERAAIAYRDALASAQATLASLTPDEQADGEKMYHADYATDVALGKLLDCIERLAPRPPVVLVEAEEIEADDDEHGFCPDPDCTDPQCRAARAEQTTWIYREYQLEAGRLANALHDLGHGETLPCHAGPDCDACEALRCYERADAHVTRQLGELYARPLAVSVLPSVSAGQIEAHLTTEHGYDQLADVTSRQGLHDSDHEHVTSADLGHVHTEPAP